MKKYTVLFVVIAFIGLMSCESDSLGDIEGMGDNPGELKVKEPYNLPDGILLLGDVTGAENPGLKSTGLKSAFDTKSGISFYGSGRYVRLQLNLLNTKEYARTVFFPKGLVWRCNNGGYQNGLTCQTTWVCIPANTSRLINVDVYCANANLLSNPTQSTTYQILGVTSSKTMWGLLDRIGWRKINFEMLQTDTKADGPTYEEITERLQVMVHQITDLGTGLTEEDIEFIQSIPELEVEERPIVDENSQFPEYFEEFKIVGK